MSYISLSHHVSNGLAGMGMSAPVKSDRWTVNTGSMLR